MHKHAHTHNPAGKRALQIRLRKIAGQIRGIENMIEEDTDCPEVLTQLVSVKRALKSFAETVIETHMHDCIDGASQPAEAKRRMKELMVVLERYVE
jgi:DNA-binding FrmR family transcriptional regulator